MIIYAVAAKIWFLKNVRFLLGHPVYYNVTINKVCVYSNTIVYFLADRTNGRAIGTVSCPSVVCLSVCTECIVAKWCVLDQKLLLTA